MIDELVDVERALNRLMLPTRAYGRCLVDISGACVAKSPKGTGASEGHDVAALATIVNAAPKMLAELRMLRAMVSAYEQGIDKAVGRIERVVDDFADGQARAHFGEEGGIGTQQATHQVASQRQHHG